MKIRILSDLHREFGPTELPPVEADVLILAGDISTKTNALPWIREFSRGVPTLYVCGNHEFYGGKLPQVTEKLVAATQGSAIHVLENSSVTVDGWHFYGCTLWTDFALQGDWKVGAAEAGEAMNDYKRIRNSQAGFRKLSPNDTRLIHLRSLRAMENFLGSHDPAKTVVVTHHAPSIQSLPERRRDRPISGAYTSHLDEFVARNRPAVWIHGHIHHSSDYRIGSTRIIANPQGYPETPNEDFQPDLNLEL